MPRFKAGVVTWKLHHEVERAIPLLDEISMRIIKRPIVITSAREGTHSERSLHYKGQAIDLRTHDLSANQIALLVKAFRNALPAGWDIVVEATHLHCEWDPK